MRGIELLEPEFGITIQKLIDECNKKGLPVLITDTLRTKDEQNMLYAQGRTAPGSIVTNVKYPNSMHNWGVAADFARNVKGHEWDDSDGFFQKVGEIGERLGLEWGGRWSSMIDKPHLQFKKYATGSTPGSLIKKYGTPEAFMKTWQLTAGEDEVEVRYNKVHEMPAYAQPTIQKLITKGILNGDENGNLNLSEDMIRIFVINDRAGLYAALANL